MLSEINIFDHTLLCVSEVIRKRQMEWNPIFNRDPVVGHWCDKQHL